MRYFQYKLIKLRKMYLCWILFCSFSAAKTYISRSYSMLEFFL